MIQLLIQPENLAQTFNLQNECHLWFLDVSELPETTITAHKSILSKSELVRAAGLHHRQAQFIALRAFVRLCLSRYTNTPPLTLGLATEAKGKPILEAAALPITFNLSHCDTMAVLAVSLHAEVGVDIESITRKRNTHSIANRYFHPHEIAELAQLKPADYQRDFFRLWTLKEAFFKAIGTGISTGLDKARFSFNGDNIHVALAVDIKSDANDWQFYQTFLSTDYCVALARQAKTPVNIRWFAGADLFL